MADEKIRTGYRMNGSIIEGALFFQYHDGREMAEKAVGLTEDELRKLSEMLDDLAYRVEEANNALSTPKPKAAREGSE